MQPVQLELDRQSQGNGKQTVIRLKGKLALESVHNFIQTMRAEPTQELIVDLSDVSFLDSAGVGALVQIFVHRRSAGQKFALTGLTKQSYAVIQVAGLTKLLPIYGTVEEAMAASA
jgi:anti-anti-sigma factor